MSIARILKVVLLFTIVLGFSGCSSHSGTFKIEGRLLNMNQAEFYLYSPDGILSGVDTIKVVGGRFAYQMPCKSSGTLVMIFPNFSEQPIFAQAGKSVSISGDASHLKEITIKGTKENEKMNSLRKRMAKATPEEEAGVAEEFILENLTSTVSVYVLKRYFTLKDNKNIEKAIKLAEQLQENQPSNSELGRFIRYAQIEKNSSSGASMPSFSAKDIYGKSVSKSNLKGKVTVVYTWASWSFESRNIRDKLNKMKEDYGSKLTLLALNMDASKQTCKQNILKDSLSSITICDGLMFESPLMDKFALGNVPDNIIYDAKGCVIEHGLALRELEDKLKKLLD